VILIGQPAIGSQSVNEPRVPIHPQPSFNDVRRCRTSFQAGARLLPANEKLYEENIKLRKVVVSDLISEGRNEISDKLLAWALNELAPGDTGRTSRHQRKTMVDNQHRMIAGQHDLTEASRR
jgi:hypothetical protein